MADQRHLYEYNVNPNTAAAMVVQMVGSGKRVLELGSGPGSITRLLKDNQCRVTALELDSSAIKIVSEYCEKVFSCDLNEPDWPDKLSDLGRFEVIVAADVLEHLYAPWGVLNRLQSLLVEGGYLVISLPHIGHNAIVACLLSGDFGYQPWGLLDKTHIRFFGIRNIQQLFSDTGFKIIESAFITKSPEQTEFARLWRKLPSKTRQALDCNKFGTVYQVVVKAVTFSAPGDELQLISQPVPSPLAGSYSAGAKGSKALGFLISFLSMRTRQKISQIFERVGFRL